MEDLVEVIRNKREDVEVDNNKPVSIGSISKYLWEALLFSKSYDKNYYKSEVIIKTKEIQTGCSDIIIKYNFVGKMIKILLELADKIYISCKKNHNSPKIRYEYIGKDKHRFTVTEDLYGRVNLIAEIIVDFEIDEFQGKTLVNVGIQYSPLGSLILLYEI